MAQRQAEAPPTVCAIFTDVRREIIAVNQFLYILCSLPWKSK